MSVMELLQQLLTLLQEQIEAVVQGDSKAILAGADRHAQILADLKQAEMDGSPEAVRALVEQVEFQKAKLQSLLASEAGRVDYLLRLLTNSGVCSTVGYPGMAKSEGSSWMLNRRA